MLPAFVQAKCFDFPTLSETCPSQDGYSLSWLLHGEYIITSLKIGVPFGSIFDEFLWSMCVLSLPVFPIATFSFSFSFSSCASEIGETKKRKASGPFGGRDMFLDCNYAILYFHCTKYIRMLDTCVRNFGQARSTNLPNNPIHPFEATFCHQRALFSLSLFCNSNALASASSLPQWPWCGVILAAAEHVYLTLRLFFGVPNQIEIINAEIAIRVCPSKANIHIFLYNIYIYVYPYCKYLSDIS